MVRRVRGPTRSSTRVAAQRTPTPLEPSDDEMPDAPSRQSTAPEDGAEQQDDDDAEDADEDAPSTPAAESDVQSYLRSRATPQSIPQKRRAGRPPKHRPVDWDASDAEAKVASDTGTPKRRGGFRGGRGFGAGRWKNRAGTMHVSQVPLDKEGNMANVVNDEVELPEDPEGETKVDKNGHLLGQREYRVRTFTVAEKGDRLYMLSTEPARCIGFRDSYLFFQKHRQLFKIILTDEAKKDLIERDLIPHSYKGRAIGVVTARSVFREFGARIVIGGKKVIDDYQVAAARSNGDVEGELADPTDIVPGPNEVYNRNQYVAWHGASSVYHSGMPTIPAPVGKVEFKKRKVQVTGSNWMLEHAREASRFNSSIAENRRLNINGVYDIYTNQLHYPKITQPTHARWEQVNTHQKVQAQDKESTLLNGVGTSLTNGHANSSKKTLVPDSSLLNGTPVASQSVTALNSESIFSPISPFQYRNTATIDVIYKNPPLSGLGVPGPYGDMADVGSSSILDIPESVAYELPGTCLAALRGAQAKELQWKESFSFEKDDTKRVNLKITYAQW